MSWRLMVTNLFPAICLISHVNIILAELVNLFSTLPHLFFSIPMSFFPHKDTVSWLFANYYLNYFFIFSPISQ